MAGEIAHQVAIVRVKNSGDTVLRRKGQKLRVGTPAQIENLPRRLRVRSDTARQSPCRRTPGGCNFPRKRIPQLDRSIVSAEKDPPFVRMPEETTRRP